ncbi:MAG: translation elongation factor Ts [Ignavibacteria bacterium GWF2_33_9]|nr:MAG: translation elongation factor Ts [Ignavibacteria bacterium GWF2_33_9]
MANITPQMVKELRDMTGAGMGDCKKALVESNGDIKEAIEYLRKKGAASAAKRAAKTANEGIILTKTNDNNDKAVIVEINCETDFVARNEEFVKYVETVRDAYFANDIQTTEQLMGTSINNDTIQGLHNEILAKFSENISVKRFDKVCANNGYIVDYIHGGNKLAVLVEFEGTNNLTDGAKNKSRDIAMQIAAMSPRFVDRSEVNQDTLDKEKEIYTQLAIDEGKKPEIAERIAQGKLDKFFSEFCLNEQTFVKDPKKVINDVVKEISSELGADVKIKSFRRFALGESNEE